MASETLTLDDLEGKYIASIRHIYGDLALLLKEEPTDDSYIGSVVFKSILNFGHQKDPLAKIVEIVDNKSMGIVSLFLVQRKGLKEDDYSDFFIPLEGHSYMDKHEIMICAKEMIISSDPYLIFRIHE